ncbi:calcium-transporting ATPase 12, plasma membrane-type-like [Olea europaea var. sylvestris]|uniref:calcium-transporting ATPase 12, plasma membrane-type-like n=1 Tax=Olea europaea var. sylvestris TaxID=158386 RepID=UPI000C1D1CA9|nr:calcium-transporting ATPase 12, plasma membrane-type-like [Olea europaea var. sylvestris]
MGAFSLINSLSDLRIRGMTRTHLETFVSDLPEGICTAFMLSGSLLCAIDESWQEGLSENRKTEQDELVWSTMFLHLSNSVIRKVGETKIAIELWTALEKYTSLNPYQINVFFGDNEQKVVGLLNALGDKYKDIRNTLEYDRSDLTVEIIHSSLLNRELEFKSEYKEVYNVEGVSPKQRTHAKVSTLDGGGVTTIFTALDRVDVLRTTINNCQLHIPESNALTGDEFRNLTNEERMQKVGTIRILGSCTPQDKVTLLNFLKEKGEVVAVLGLQTNDAPALKEADIGLTMGIRSSEMAKECSDLIIWNADFTFLVNGIKSGRRTYENIRKFIQFQLVNIISSSLVNSIATIFLGDAPMTAMELFWLNLVVALLGGLALLTMPPAENLMKMPPIRTSGRLITNATWRNIAIQVSYQTAICSILLLKGSAVLGISADAIKSMICNSLFLCQLFNKIIAREPEKNNIFERLHQNRWFWVAFVLFLMSQAAMTATENVLGISASLSWKLWALCILIGLVSWPLDFAGKCASDFHTRCLLQIKAGNEGDDTDIRTAYQPGSFCEHSTIVEEALLKHDLELVILGLCYHIERNINAY